eukprot:jgi/Mesvir1/15973/Mv26462-RA.2
MRHPGWPACSRPSSGLRSCWHLRLPSNPGPIFYRTSLHELARLCTRVGALVHAGRHACARGLARLCTRVGALVLCQTCPPHTLDPPPPWPFLPKPQFSDMGPLPQHGFARNHPWKVVESPVDSPLTAGASIPWVVLELQLNKEDADERVRTWANSSTCRLRVALGEADGSLSMQMTVSNTGQAPLSFTFAFHTYYATDDISKVSVRGLQGCDYLDNLQARIKLEDAADSITFAQEVDRIYLDAPDSITVVDAGKSRPLQLRKQGLPDAVVWNPWEAKAKSTKDLKDDDYLRMFCVESGVMGVPVTLPPGQTWQGVQQVCVL